MLLAVERAGVKHAYVTSHQYLPIFNHARELLSEGLIGQVREIEFVFHGNISPLSPYSWTNQLNLGGGTMYNIFTGLSGILRRVTGAEVIAATGEARNLIDRAPIGPEFHDMRDTGGPIDREVAEAGEWGEVDADLAFTVLLELRMPGGHKTSALIQVSFMAPSPIPLYLAYYGTEGAIHLSGSFMPERLEHFSPERESWEEIPVPQRLFDAWGPHHETRGRRASTRVQRNWNQFFSEFIADVRGEGVGGYETFREGWLDNEIVDGVRSRKGWTTLPQSQ
jgi:predicted dehydrogenase